MNNLAIRIMCVPERIEMARKLQKDFEPWKAVLCLDREYRGTMFGRKLTLIDSCESHILSVQEDIQICKNFVLAILRLIEFFPNEIISFYTLRSEKSKADTAINNNLPFYQAYYTSGQAILFPRKQALQFIRFTDRFIVQPKGRQVHDDTILEGWLNINRISVLHTIPNLVEHLGSEKSTVGLNFHNKVSACYIEEKDPLQIDWKRNLDKIKLYETPISNSFYSAYRRS